MANPHATPTDPLIPEGLNGVQVRQNGAAAVFESSFLTSPDSPQQIPDVLHNQTEELSGGPFRFKAPAAPLGTSDLINVTLEDWQPDFEHINLIHAKAAPGVNAIHRDNVLRS
jgi:hypothetical protein